ncbi:hypothetical protein EDD17DRAFT_1616337 [Pisolithus thermaeus]|nr:hypothetical protein EDD17DRAFT_1616337 [Pisolithus thermaeus]
MVQSAAFLMVFVLGGRHNVSLSLQSLFTNCEQLGVQTTVQVFRGRGESHSHIVEQSVVKGNDASKRCHGVM